MEITKREMKWPSKKLRSINTTNGAQSGKKGKISKPKINPKHLTKESVISRNNFWLHQSLDIYIYL
jgi:hypothetical protein